MAGEWEGMVGKGKGYGGDGHFRTVTHFTHKEIVPYQERFFQRARGDNERLEEEQADERCGDHGEE